jgi:hypothetical protein
MPATDLVLADPRFSQVHDAVMRILTTAADSPQHIKSDIPLETALSGYGLPSEWWPTGGGCTARIITFDPDGIPAEHALHIVITCDASVDRPIAHHSGWWAMQYGPEFDGYRDNLLYNSEFSISHPTLADMAYDSVSCARAIRDWYDGITTTWTCNEVTLEGVGGIYCCQTRSEHWDGYCAPRFSRDVMQQICEDTQRAHGKGLWGAPATFKGDTVVIETAQCRTEVCPDSDGYYRPGAFYWPWGEHTDRHLTHVRNLLREIQWGYERKDPLAWTVIAADHGWRVKVIDVIPAPSPTEARDVAVALYGELHAAALTSYEVSVKTSGEAAAAVRAHFAATRAERDPDAKVQATDRPGGVLPLQGR